MNSIKFSIWKVWSRKFDKVPSMKNTNQLQYHQQLIMYRERMLWLSQYNFLSSNVNLPVFYSWLRCYISSVFCPMFYIKCFLSNVLYQYFLSNVLYLVFSVQCSIWSVFCPMFYIQCFLPNVYIQFFSVQIFIWKFFCKCFISGDLFWMFYIKCFRYSVLYQVFLCPMFCI